MSDFAQLIETIRWRHRECCFAMESRIRIDHSLGCFLRMAMGWRASLPAAEREAIKARALAIVKGTADAGPFGEIVAASVAARAPWEAAEKAAVKEMERLARQLPVWGAFGARVRGFGLKGLAVIVGEAGDLSAYPKKGHLWKRMGVALVGGVRQGGLTKNAPKEDWVKHGYNRQRRSRLFAYIGEPLIRAQGPYREIYLARKAYERKRAEAAGLTVLPAAKISAKNRGEAISEMHVHLRAKRYMEKRLLRDLWQAWNRGEATDHVPIRDKLALPNPDHLQPAAIHDLPTEATPKVPPAASIYGGVGVHA